MRPAVKVTTRWEAWPAWLELERLSFYLKSNIHAHRRITTRNTPSHRGGPRFAYWSKKSRCCLHSVQVTFTRRTISYSVLRQFRVIRTQLISPIWKIFTENRLLAQNLSAYFRYNVGGNRTAKEPVIPAIFHDMEVPPVPELNGVDEYDAGSLGTYYAAKNGMNIDAERSFVSAKKNVLADGRALWLLINRD